MIKKAIHLDPARPFAPVPSGISVVVLTAPQWKICDAPAGGCGGGRRKGFLTMATSCPTCGSQLRVLKNQERRS